MCFFFISSFFFFFSLISLLQDMLFFVVGLSSWISLIQIFSRLFFFFVLVMSSEIRSVFHSPYLFLMLISFNFLMNLNSITILTQKYIFGIILIYHHFLCHWLTGWHPGSYVDNTCCFSSFTLEYLYEEASKTLHPPLIKNKINTMKHQSPSVESSLLPCRCVN